MPVFTLVVIAIVAIGAIAWVGISWVVAGRQALEVRDRVTAMRATADARDWGALSEQATGLLEASRSLASSTSGVPWWLLERAPVVGPNAQAVSAVADSAAALLEAAEPLLPYADRLMAGEWRRPDGSIDVDLLTTIAGPLQALADTAEVEAARLDGIDDSSLRPEVAEALGPARDQIRSAAPALATAAGLAARAGGLLGADGERRWLVLLQNPAEARGSGGFPGGYVTVTVDDGAIAIDTAGKGGDLYAEPIPTAGAPADSREMWGTYLTRWNTFNLSPHFPLTGRLAADGIAAWGTDVDGVIAVDPRTVAAMLAVTGPVSAGDVTIDAGNAERFFTVDSYTQIPDMNERREVTLALVTAALQAFLTQDWDPIAFAQAMQAPVEQGRVRMWSEDADEQGWLESTSLGGTVPDTPGPVVAVAFNNAAGNKMDAFLATGVEYRPGTCPTATEQASGLTVTLRNDAPAGLDDTGGDYGRADDAFAPRGSTKVLVHVYAPVGAVYRSSTLDGSPVPLYLGAERGRPIWWTSVTLQRGQEATIDVAFTEPTVLGVEPRVITQPMVVDEVVSVTPDPACPVG